jgi:hypothetical protein
MRKSTIAIVGLLGASPCFVYAGQHSNFVPVPSAHAPRAAAAPAPHAAPPVRPGVPGRPVARPTAPYQRPMLPHGTTARSAKVPFVPRTPWNSYPGSVNSGCYGAPIVAGNAIPGLGFDFEHYAAVHPYSRCHLFNTGFAVPYLGGSMYVPYPSYGENNASAGESAQSNPSESQGVAEQPSERESGGTAFNHSNLGTSLEPLLEFAFVRRDGTIFFAVAYSWAGGNLQYITKDGLRRTALRETLDLNATQQFNEQRGVDFRLPA